MLPAQRFRDAVLAVIYRLFFLCLLRRLMQSTIPAPAMLNMKYFAVSPTVSPVFAADVLFARLPEALFLSAPLPGLEPLFCPGLFSPGFQNVFIPHFAVNVCGGHNNKLSLCLPGFLLQSQWFFFSDVFLRSCLFFFSGILSGQLRLCFRILLILFRTGFGRICIRIPGLRKAIFKHALGLKENLSKKQLP